MDRHKDRESTSTGCIRKVPEIKHAQKTTRERETCTQRP